MSVSDPAGDGEAEARAATLGFSAGAGFVGAEKTLEDARLKVGRNSLSLISDADHAVLAFAPASELHGGGRRRIFDGVVE